MISIFIPLLLLCLALPTSHSSSLHVLVACTLTSRNETIIVHYVLKIQLNLKSSSSSSVVSHKKFEKARVEILASNSSVELLKVSIRIAILFFVLFFS